MSDYTPDTERVRNGYTYYGDDGGEFDRWLASVKAEAWDEGFLLATRNNPNKPHPMLRMNPYRTEES